MKRIAALVLVLLAAASSAAARSSSSGLHGKICRGTPPAPGTLATCTQPMRTVLVFTNISRTARTTSTATGAYRVSLAAGIYRVTVPYRGIGSGPRVRPGLVKVRAGHDDRLDFYVELRSTTSG